jgi:hypothetical protein
MFILLAGISVIHWVILLIVVLLMIGVPLLAVLVLSQRRRSAGVGSPDRLTNNNDLAGVTVESSEPAWEAHADTLRQWYVVYLACWIGGAVLYILGTGMEESSTTNAFTMLGGSLFVGSLLLYVVCMVYAYRVQAALNAAGLYKHGAWQIIVAALILNPGCLGFYVPLSVLLAARRIRKRLASRNDRSRQEL